MKWEQNAFIIIESAHNIILPLIKTNNVPNERTLKLPFESTSLI